MSVTFYRAETVSEGDPITSHQFASLSEAINSRIKSGLGDGAYRIAQLIFNGFRQVRTPADSAGRVFPSQGEWFEVYSHINDSAYTWPLTGPGEPEGANLANVMNQFVFGNPIMYSEPDRLGYGRDETGEFGVPMSLVLTDEDAWDLAKRQRGAIDPDTGLQNVPVMTAAQSFFTIVTPYYSPHGKSYGGFFPTPIELSASCGATEETGLYIPSYEIKFTGLLADIDTSSYHGTVSTNGDGMPVVSYIGSCPFGTDDTAAGHVVGALYLPLVTYIAVNDGAGGYFIDVFSNTEWLEGPYEGTGVLARRDGTQVSRAVWNFITEFRGTSAQREDDNFEIEKIGFDFQEFFTRQYYLAPARATFSGEELEARYPLARWASATPGNQLMLFGDQSSYQIRSGFVFAGFFIKAERLAQPVSVEVQGNDGSGWRTLKTVLIEPDGNAQGTKLHYFNNCETLSVRALIKSTMAFTAADGFIQMEVAELYEYKPQFWDAYLLLRMSATNGGDAIQGGVDGSGADESEALTLWDNYRINGCIVNGEIEAPRAQSEWINSNPVYEAMRKRSREYLRIFGRRQFLSYAVSGGKSILKFRRYVHYPAIPAESFDVFEGIGPSMTPMESGQLKLGERYRVRGTTGSVTYRGGSIQIGQIFTAIVSKDFETTGDCAVYEYEGIRTTAPEKGLTNEWVMFLQTKRYHQSESSIWKPEAYADYFTWNNRCHFYSGSAGDPAFRRHLNYNTKTAVNDNLDGTFTTEILSERVQASFIAPEAPSGYNYSSFSNDTGVTDDFYRSCQIYQAPYVIESVTSAHEEGVGEVVTITLAERMQYHADAPATVDEDPTSWSTGEKDDLAAESYRTDDNALREYALHQADPARHASVKTGDNGTSSSVNLLPDNPWGSVYPHFFLVKLMPRPRTDGNETIEPTDTRATIDAFTQAETYLRAMCEGFVDGITSAEITCQTGAGSLYDYTFENLCYEAFGGRSIGPFPDAVREDLMQGFGPLPNTHMYADVFNRLSACVNLLTRVRVELPFKVECQVHQYYGETVVNPSWTNGGGTPNCNTAADYAAIFSVGNAPVSLDSTIPWSDCGSTVGSSFGTNIDTSRCATGAAFYLVTTGTKSDYRVAIDGNSYLAIPASWQADVSSIGGFLGEETTQTVLARCDKATSFADSDGCCPPGTPSCFGDFWDTGNSTGYKNCRGDIIAEETVCKILDRTGTIDAGMPPAGTYSAANDSGIPAASCANSSSQSKSFEVFTAPGFVVSPEVTAYPDEV
jgi:hypothetical protein